MRITTRYLFIITLICIFSGRTVGQLTAADNLIVVVLDGMRWQEVFMGADSALISNSLFTKDKASIKAKFWDDDTSLRRKKLFPFLWNNVQQQGRLYGNRTKANYINVSNPYQLTYPGFSEMLTGYADPAIRSNSQLVSHSENVLEFINQQHDFQNKVALFATSDLFPFLLDKKNSKLYINADTDTFSFPGYGFRLINQMQRLVNKPTTERPDLLTYFAAREYVKQFHPRVLYLALGETDAFAHAGNYDQYLETAFTEDKMISELWNLIQSMPQYHNKTALLVTCDHGRGDSVKTQWRQHGPDVHDSGEIWLAMMGPGISPQGEVGVPGQLYQGQIASTMAVLLGLNFKPRTHEAMAPVRK